MQRKGHLKQKYLNCSDESEPSWLEPELELKDFQLDSAGLGLARGLFPFSSKFKIGRKRAEILIFDFFFLLFFFNYYYS